MALYDYTRAQRLAHRQIAKFGGGVGTGRLEVRSTGARRVCTVAIMQYTTSERDGSLIQYADERALVSAVGLTADPDWENELLVHGRFVAGTWRELKKMRIVAPPGKLAPGGVVVFWDLQVRGLA